MSMHTESEVKQDLLDTTTALGLEQLINEATYITETSANILDLIFTDSPGRVTECGTLPPLGTSLHAVVWCTFNQHVQKAQNYKKEIWKYGEGDIEGLNVAIGDFPFADILPQNPSQSAEIWTHTLLTIAKEYIPCHTIIIHPQDKPWMTHEIKKMIKKRNKSFL